MADELFAAIPGQAAIKAQFRRALRDGTVAHATLLSGREGLAKYAFALELAAALVSGCGGCGDCPDCRRARQGTHPDLHLLEREGEFIRVDQILPLLADLSLKPFSAGQRVWVIPEAEMLHPAAANRLLKSIEEPPADVYFILVSDRLERMLPTIVSRCQVSEFAPLADAEIAAYLAADRQLDDLEAGAIVRLAAGSVDRAARLADDAQGPRRRAAYLEQVAALLDGASASAATDFIAVFNAHREAIKEEGAAMLEKRLAEIEQVMGSSREARRWREQAEAWARRDELRRTRLAALDALAVVTSWLRDLWVVSLRADKVVCNCDRLAEVTAAAVATPDHYARLLFRAGEARKDFSLNITYELAFKALFARLASGDADA